jgi:8-oxo-dGTP pyrophosphatase MutT (NUDIX family)
LELLAYDFQMETVRRKACRGLLVTPEQEILLIKIANPNGQWIGWITPGGGMEPGEDEFTALHRELYEELGYELREPPPKVWRRTHKFPWVGRMIEQEEAFFLIRTPRFAPHTTPALTESELFDFREVRWWKLAEIVDSRELFAPRALAEALAELLAGNLPEAALELAE